MKSSDDFHKLGQQLAKLGQNDYLMHAANAVIQKALVLNVKWYLAFSGGKDSTVMLDLVLAQKPDIDVVWFDDGWNYPETIDFLKFVEDSRHIKIIRVSYEPGSAFFRHSVPYGGDDPAVSHRCDMDEHEFDDSDFGGAFIGLRKKESAIRRYTMERRGTLFQSKSDRNRWRCYPLADWAAMDIWRYIFANGLRYNLAYDKLYSLGLDLDKMRVGPLTAWMVYQYGILTILKQGWPDLFNRFAAAMPGVRAYV